MRSASPSSRASPLLPAVITPANKEAAGSIALHAEGKASACLCVVFQHRQGRFDGGKIHCWRLISDSRPIICLLSGRSCAEIKGNSDAVDGDKMKKVRGLSERQNERKEDARKSKMPGVEILITASTERLSGKCIILVFITLLK